MFIMLNNFTNISGELIDDDVITRVFPQLGVEWRYPLVRRGPGYTHLIEPRAMLVAAPDSGNSDDIPNEDSLNFAFDDTALFRLNRFNGRDRLSSGTHADYGVKLAVHGDGGGETSLFIGQSMRLSGDHTFTGESGLGGRLSDYVGHLIMAPTDTLDLHYRFRLDRDDLSAHRSELGFRYRQGRFGWASTMSRFPPGAVVPTCVTASKSACPWGLASAAIGAPISGSFTTSQTAKTTPAICRWVSTMRMSASPSVSGLNTPIPVTRISSPIPRFLASI